MKVEVRWLRSPRVSSFHAGDIVRRALPTTDAVLADRLAAPLARLRETLAPLAADEDAFWDAAIPLSATVEDPRQLAAAALRAATEERIGDADAASSVAAAFEELTRVAHDLWPNLPEELRLRERPLREQWESRGPGFLRRFGELASWPPGACEVCVALTPPCLGGGGMAHPASGLVRFEAVLANPWMELPEPLRLGWLLGHVVCEGQCSPPPLARPRRRLLAALAALALALEAGEHVEWTHAPRELLPQALRIWRPPLPPGASVPEVAAQLAAWRDRLGDAKMSWSAALDGLHQLLPARSEDEGVLKSLRPR